MRTSTSRATDLALPTSSPSVLPLVNLLNRFHGVDILGQLVFAHAHDTRKSQRVTAVVTIAAHDGVEGHFQHDRWLNLARVSMVGRGMREKPLRQLGNFLVGQT